jgi:hypothetical protein
MRHKQDSLPDCADPVPTLLTVDRAVFAKHHTRIGESRDAFSKSMPACFFWFDRFFSASHSKRTLLYITYNTAA